ncbi:MAG: peptidylprolyl isomerase [Halobacteriales archaeon]
MPITTGDSVTIEFTGRLPDGTVFDTSRQAVAEESELAEGQPEREFSPLTIEIGNGRVIDGLEEALLEKEEGASFTETIPPEKGYGEWTEENVREWPADEFSQMVGGQTPEQGDYIETEDGGLAEIIHVDEEVVRVDFNHELAGEALEFDIEITAVN